MSSRHRSPSPNPEDPKASHDRLANFLADFAKIDLSNEAKTFCHNFTNNQEVQSAIYRSLVHGQDVELLQQLCSFLLYFYRTTIKAKNSGTFIPTSTANDMVRGRVVVLQYLPHLINLHLTVRTRTDRNRFKFVDAFLLAIYNSEAVEQQSALTSSSMNVPPNPLQRPVGIKVPSLASSSIYHDSARLESEDKLDQRPSGLAFQFEVARFVDNLTASSRPWVLRLLLQTFNRHIVDVSKIGLDQFTRATLKLLERGFSGKDGQLRVHLEPPVLLELLYSAYVCMYNGFQVAANQIVDMIHARASLAGCPDVLLLSNSIKSLVLTSSPSQVSSHVSTPAPMAKNMITNASFRAKKMHMDIPKVQVDAAIPDDAHPPTRPNLASMTSIVEEDGGSKDEEKTPSKEPSSSNKGFNPDKLIAKLRKKTLSIAEEPESNGSSEKPKTKSSGEKKLTGILNKDKKKNKLAEAAANNSDAAMSSPLMTSVHNGDSASNNSKEYDTVEKVEELIQMKRLPPETITIHSPESGTTIF